MSSSWKHAWFENMKRMSKDTGGGSSGSPATLGFPSSSKIGTARVSPDQDATSDSQDGTYDLINPLVLAALKDRISEDLYDDVVAAASDGDVAALARLLGQVMIELSAAGNDPAKALVTESLRKASGDISLLAVAKARSAPLAAEGHALSKDASVRAVQEARSVARLLSRDESIAPLAKVGR